MILVTGGLGYVGSFTALELIKAGYKVIILDNCYNASEEVINRIFLLTGVKPEFLNVDLTNKDDIYKVFTEHPEISGVIHFAALKAVGESSQKPLEYYQVNVAGTVNLLMAMKAHNVNNFVFSSSATVYGDASLHEGMIPIPEHCPLSATSPYGQTKIIVEQVINDYSHANPEFKAALLRYFNPCGAHPSGIMGEDPNGIPFNLLPLLSQVATGKRKQLDVYGDDYDSKDGTAIRDYIHIVDLARGHLAALKKLDSDFTGCRAWNLGTGMGSTVYDIIHAFENAIDRPLAYEVKPRRKGDVLNLTAVVDRAHEELGWKCELTLENACEDLWRWVENNPEGYKQSPPQALLDSIKKSN